MGCSSYTLGGFAKDCQNNIGGIKTIYLANWDEVTATVAEGANGNKVTVSGGTWKSYWVRRGSASMNSTATKNVENGNSFVTTVLTYSMARMDATKRAEMCAMLANDVAVIVEDGNGVKHFLGKDNAVEATNGGGATGTAYTDANAYNIELTDTSLEMPYIVDESWKPEA